MNPIKWNSVQEYRKYSHSNIGANCELHLCCMQNWFRGCMFQIFAEIRKRDHIIFSKSKKMLKLTAFLASTSIPETWKSVTASADQQIRHIPSSRLQFRIFQIWVSTNRIFEKKLWSCLTQISCCWSARWRPPSKLKDLTLFVAPDP